MQRVALRRPLVLLVVAALVAVGLWQTRGRRPSYALSAAPEGIMGTSCRLAVVPGEGGDRGAESALRRAEEGLRADEALLSSWIDESEIGRLNRAPAGESVPLSPLTERVLRAAREAHQLTGGAFDVTVRPLIRLWREAGQRDRLPTEDALEAARRRSRWGDLELGDGFATKRIDGFEVDLGGIAKGLAIDRALDRLREGGVRGALVDVGGDVRMWGRPTVEGPWTVQVRHPFAPGSLLELHVEGGAVCTSGNYARFTRIEGRHYGHILDPRSGRPAEAVPSVTVHAPTALQADVWATALSVLGEEGLEQLPEGVEALLVLGTADRFELLATSRMAERLRPRPEALRVFPFE